MPIFSSCVAAIFSSFGHCCLPVTSLCRLCLHFYFPVVLASIAPCENRCVNFGGRAQEKLWMATGCMRRYLCVMAKKLGHGCPNQPNLTLSMSLIVNTTPQIGHKSWNLDGKEVFKHNKSKCYPFQIWYEGKLWLHESHCWEFAKWFNSQSPKWMNLYDGGGQSPKLISKTPITVNPTPSQLMQPKSC